ncbi:keratin, type I cytoskeletal 23 isoform X1 [Hylobates moloch]|uniref:keratin, type I cytoskeletal 23 isoform X1 n=1 Tax=Hylobates moloch TaxID=81572 RepID=UPI001363AB1A|nr:keratin, type I cytoskeletal 23 isoform X1 [Hylobates moloch]XP_058300787.1 keratin, type I cytoskeletal 23 isoform X1 [Hylobates moloch]XP_058300788.1 keratin, type I cytoskeletal 23 isoform X1 [Hylobates moloch]
MNSGHSFSQTPSASFHGAGGGWGRPRSFPRAPTVHGGAGGARISLSFTTRSCPPAGGSWGSGRSSPLLGGNGKATMQNLNDRLASYLEKVRALEEANMKLESRILKWHQQRDPGSKKDYSHYEENITHLQEQIVDGKMTNAQIILLIDNARMAVDDFNLKYENEHSFKKDLEIEVEGLRRTLDNLTIVTTDLEQEVEGMRKELILMKKRHEQEMEKHHVPSDFNVNVKVDTGPREDLIKVLEDMRQEYELIIKKKHRDLDTWYKEQSAAMSQEAASPAAVQSRQGDIHELKRTFQALEIDLQAQYSTKSALENMLSETQSRYSCKLQDMQEIISHYEEELMQLRHDLERQNNEYQVLLGIKTHLEKEITTYRRLLEGESDGTREESKSSMKASATPKIKAITQETINGRLVLCQVNEIQKHA